jgi:hypothetical protein
MLLSGHKVPMHEIVSSVNCFIFFHLIGPYFFDTSVTAYLNTLQTWFVPQLRERGLEATAVLQEDGAPAHCALQLENNLTTDSVDDGLDVGLTWCGLLEVQS